MDRIGRYRIAGEVGRGAMGVVYRASDSAIGRDVAIKTIRLDGTGDAPAENHDVLRDRLFREARSAGVLSHPNIVTIFDMGEDHVADIGPVAWVAMALVKGPSLETLLRQPEALAGSRIFSLLRQTAMALDYAHARGVVHRDIKPANIMTDEDESVKITDFGIAKFIAAERLNESTVTGTPNYMSPEQVQGLDIDGRTDQFSLGVVAWEMLTGERPFAGEDVSTVICRIVSEAPLPAHHLNGTLTPRIDETLRRVLDKDPGRRFANCASFVGALEMACGESPGWAAAVGGAAAHMPTVAMNWETSPPAEPSPIPVLAPEPEVVPDEKRRWLFFTLATLAAAAGFALFAFWPTADVKPLGAPVVRKELAPAIVAPPIVVPPPTETPSLATPRVETSAPEPTRRFVPSPSSTVMQDIWITTNPPGARASIDGKAGVCSSPCVLYAPQGKHQITFTMSGFRTERREIQVHDKTVDMRAVDLQPVMGSLLVSSTPPGASILLNGQPVSQTTPASLPLKPGTYTVTVSKDGMTRTEHVKLGESPHLLRIPLR